MSGIKSALGDIVKSVQTGSTVLANGVGSNTATVTAINTAKSYLYITNDSSQAADGRTDHITGAITNATTLTFTRGGTTGGVTVIWQLVEFY